MSDSTSDRIVKITPADFRDKKGREKYDRQKAINEFGWYYDEDRNLCHDNTIAPSESIDEVCGALRDAFDFAIGKGLDESQALKAADSSVRLLRNKGLRAEIIIRRGGKGGFAAVANYNQALAWFIDECNDEQRKLFKDARAAKNDDLCKQIVMDAYNAAHQDAVDPDADDTDDQD